MRPLVSVIIPTFNRAALLTETLRSVSEQTYRELEIIVVDDGSTDETPGVLSRLSAVEPRLRVARQPNRGVAAARQAGFELSTGELIQYLDSDDLLDQRKIELQVQQLVGSPDHQIAYGPVFHLRDGVINDSPARRSGEQIDELFPAILEARLWDTGSALIRRSACELAGPWSDLSCEEDWEYDTRLALTGAKALWVPDAITYYRLRDPELMGVGNSSTALLSRIRAHMMIFEHARAAGTSESSPQFRSFGRQLFLLARQSAAAGFTSEAKELMNLSASIHRTSDLAAYRAISSILGWRTTARIANWTDRLR